MKRILITGKNSYVGNRLKEWLEHFPEKYLVDLITLRNDSWKEKDFSGYDVIFHVAGIAHIKETRENASLYYNVNRDLAFETAGKAKKDGIKQFIFLSSMSVYGVDTGLIIKTTPLNPKSHYGKSKLQAEDLIKPLEDDKFKIAIVRPPMIYGKGCKGNYPKLSRLALKTPVFPEINNKRSMIYIDNFCEFIRLLIDDYNRGVFFPQNEEYVCTSDMVRVISEVHGNRIFMTKFFNPFIRMLKINTINKVFGDLVYDKNMSQYQKNYCVCSFVTSIKVTEMEKEVTYE